MNALQPVAVLEPLQRALGGSVRGKTILLLGMAFKPGTDDVRESASLKMARHLHAEGARIIAHDPIAMPNALEALGKGIVQPVEDWNAAIQGADAVIVATRWPEYERLSEMSALLDGKVLFDPRRLFKRGTFPNARHLVVGFTPAPASTPAREKENQSVQS